ncbi:hypothetical protein EAO73_34585 [Streptomyces sp. col6]|uniref:hypothetical protein n=1 Tax=Streptomyces sp. col6 TaxID=2478958 RepID=UPI0011CDCBA4|nr:hypothetical protein [Streptomyces sp. col6]TXR95171.1 hypothetical protein EAO73_34585 [Streptomyces sp. col6]
MANGQNEVRMTLRVSRDSGRTWGPLKAVRVGEDPVIPENPGRYPPCVCPRCSRQAGNAVASFQMVS